MIVKASAHLETTRILSNLSYLRVDCNTFFAWIKINYYIYFYVKMLRPSLMIVSHSCLLVDIIFISIFINII